MFLIPICPPQFRKAGDREFWAAAPESSGCRVTNRPVVMSRIAVPLLLCLLCGSIARAQGYTHVRIVRLSFVESGAQLQRPGSDWEQAKLNLPIQQGFRLQTGNGYAEVEFEKGLAVRLAHNSSLEFTELSLLDGRRVTKINLSAGTVIITARLSRSDDLSIAASNLRLAVARSAQFRVDTSPTGDSVTVFHGKIDVESGSEQLSIGSGHRLQVNATELSSSPIVVPSLARDNFDKWVSQRERALSDSQSKESDDTKGFP